MYGCYIQLFNCMPIQINFFSRVTNPVHAWLIKIIAVLIIILIAVFTQIVAVAAINQSQSGLGVATN